MLKTIKTTKQMRLDELIKYVWDNGITNEYFYAGDKSLLVNELGKIVPKAHFSAGDVFTVELEEPITKVTLLEKAVYVYKNETLVTDFNTSIDETLSNHEGYVSEIYALINGKLELVWERDGE